MMPNIEYIDSILYLLFDLQISRAEFRITEGQTKHLLTFDMSISNSITQNKF